MAFSLLGDSPQARELTNRFEYWNNSKKARKEVFRAITFPSFPKGNPLFAVPSAA
jgi:hypothetical protein